MSRWAILPDGLLLLLDNDDLDGLWRRFLPHVNTEVKACHQSCDDYANSREPEFRVHGTPCGARAKVAAEEETHFAK
jgi:hypothetical protein